MKTESEALQAFWEAWPNKKAKGDARRAWKQVGGDELIDEILSAIPAYVQDVQSKGWLNWAYPASWLRAERWCDEYSEPESKVSEGANDFLKRRQQMRVVQN